MSWDFLYALILLLIIASFAPLVEKRHICWLRKFLPDRVDAVVLVISTVVFLGYLWMNHNAVVCDEKGYFGKIGTQIFKPVQMSLRTYAYCAIVSMIKVDFRRVTH